MRKIAVAPMLDWTDRHFRYFMRQITRETMLYTEMIVDKAIIHGDCDKLLGFTASEHPLTVQLGGSDPTTLANASRKCAEFGFDAINLNVGCPSARVKSGSFGACLMADPQLVADCLVAMRESVTIPVNIKHRIGLDHTMDYALLVEFVAQVAQSGCTEFIVHARNAILDGLTPKQNRDIPPLRYEYVYKLKEDFPQLQIMINGGIKTLAEMQNHLQHVDGVMIGREAYYNPYLFSTIDTLFFNSQLQPMPSRLDIAHAMVPYLRQSAALDIPLHHITRHMLGLFHGEAHAKLWRKTLAEEMIKYNDLAIYLQLLDFMADNMR